MSTYIIRRLLMMIPTLILVSLIVFATMRFIPGSIIDMMMANRWSEGQNVREELVAYLGLDLPIHVQYGKWITGILKGNLGNSLWTKVPVMDSIKTGLPVSLELGLLAIFISLIIAIPVGVISGIRPESTADNLLRSLAVLLICVPDFWLGTMVVIFPAIWWGVSPPVFYTFFFDDPIANLSMVLIPSIILGFWFNGMTMRLTRTMVLETFSQDYVRTAWAKGLKMKVVVIRHVLKNSLIPVVTIVGLQLPVVIGGAVAVEYIFGLPGLGKLMVEAILKRDYPIVSGINVFLASFVLIVNLLVDISYAWLDPRIKYK